jgi:hypothetical protein
MAHPFVPAVKEAQRDATNGYNLGTTPFAWAQLVFYHRGPDHPLGLPITPRYAEEAEAPPVREEEVILGSGCSRILHKGFIGRRKELHALRCDLRQGKTIHVVQGLGGLGKSAFCLEALKFYKRQGRVPLTLWCAEVEDDPDPANALLQQFSASAEQLVGADWDPIVAAVDRDISDKPMLQRPARRFVALLNALLHRGRSATAGAASGQSGVAVGRAGQR